MKLLALESIIPRLRDPEPEGHYVDGRFSPSYVDMGTLQTRACSLATPYKARGQAAYPPEFLSAVRIMVARHVRHLTSLRFDEEEGRVHFSTKDRWGEFEYSFEMKKSWFARKR